MRRLHRKIMRKVRRHYHRKKLGFLQALRLYAGMPVGV